VTPKLALIVAIADNDVIGNQGQLPWRISEDLRFFKNTTMGHAIIMGRATWASVGRPLPGRRNIVVSRTADKFEGAELARSFEEAVALARQSDEEPFVIGGAAIYEAALPVATKIYVTEVHQTPDGDTKFHLDRTLWRETSRRKGETDGVEFVTLERRADGER
jgi:dihydrofolate reductase